MFLVRLNQDFQQGIMDLEGYQKDINTIVSIDIEHKPGIFVSKYEIENIKQPQKIPTHLKTLNGWMNGGLERGELGFIFSQSGAGKSFFLVNIAVAAYRAGFDVFYYTFELSEYHTYIRIAQRITGYDDNTIYKRPSRFREKMNSRMGSNTEIYVKEFPSEGATVNNIRSDIDMIRSLYGIYPDVVIVDYCDIIKPLRSHSEDWRMVGENAVSLRRMAKELDVACWTASQIKSEFWDREYSGKATGRSMRKFDMADCAFGIVYLDPNDSEEMRRIIKALKLRRAKPPNKKMLVEFNLDKSLITDLGEYHEDRQKKKNKKEKK